MNVQIQNNNMGLLGASCKTTRLVEDTWPICTAPISQIGERADMYKLYFRDCWWVSLEKEHWLPVNCEPTNDTHTVERRILVEVNK